MGKRWGWKSPRWWYLGLAVVAVVLSSGLVIQVLLLPFFSRVPLPTILAPEVPRIDVEPAREQLARGTAILVDTRSPAEYAEAHIPGAVSIPFADMPQRYAELPQDKDIFIY